jgi:hypothetical protein
MSFESNTGLGVPTFYGARTKLEGMGGQAPTQGSKKEMVLEFSGANINDDSAMLTAILPQNSLILNAYVDVEEAVTMTGTAPTILVGTNGSEVTNGLVISEAQAEAKGIYDVTGTLTGTFAASLASDTTLGVALGGTSPTVTNDGRIKVVIEYVHVTRS